MDKYTLKRLLQEREVHIPIIQRDYAQGRADSDAQIARTSFLGEIKKCLSGKRGPIDLNFIYGTSERDSNVFYPVDGQQRLTTLYLLHWYLVCFCDTEKQNAFRKFRFCYETRNSASDFFTLLREMQPEVIDVVKGSAGRENALEKGMKNAAFFQSEWLQDPTVQSALRVLDTISSDTEFSEEANEYYDKLTNRQIIYFDLIEPTANGEAELVAAKSYVRMNARGKALEPFENVKSMLDCLEKNARDIEIQESFSYCYDVTYLNELFHSRYMSDGLAVKTKKINESSLHCLKNLYVMCRRKDKNWDRKDYKETDFVTEILSMSQNEKLEEKEKLFLRRYFEMLNVVFGYCCKAFAKEVLKDVFTDLNVVSLEGGNNNRILWATVMFLYNCEKKQIALLNTDKLEKFLYVIENLNYKKWSTSEFIHIMDRVIENTVNEAAGDIRAYFATEQLEELQTMLNGCGLADYKVRVKEQQIKAKFWSDNGEQWWDKFRTLEEKSGIEHRIHYLLYLSGYWKEYDKGSKELLERYYRLASATLDPSLNGSERWRRCYAVAAHVKYVSENEWKLCSPEEIETKCGTKHIWKNEHYFWDDTAEENLKEKEPILKNIQWIYDELNKGREAEAICNDIVGKEEYKTCWLYWSLKWEIDVLLQKELKYNLDVKIATACTEGMHWDGKKLGWRRCDRILYYEWFKKKIGEKNVKYGLPDMQIVKENEFVFKAHHKYPGIEVKDTNYTMKIKGEIKITGLIEGKLPRDYVSFATDKGYMFIRLTGYDHIEEEHDMANVFEERDRILREELLADSPKDDSVEDIEQWCKIRRRENGWSCINEKEHRYVHPLWEIPYVKEEANQ